jgi:hypothetical protein
MMIASLRLFRRDRGELYDRRLLEDLVGDFVGVRPLCLGRFIVTFLFLFSRFLVT